MSYEILTCVEYNKNQLTKWENEGTSNNLATYCWLNNKGNYKAYGYVAVVVSKSGRRTALWDKSKRALVERLREGGF